MGSKLVGANEVAISVGRQDMCGGIIHRFLMWHLIRRSFAIIMVRRGIGKKCVHDHNSLGVRVKRTREEVCSAIENG